MQEVFEFLSKFASNLSPKNIATLMVFVVLVVVAAVVQEISTSRLALEKYTAATSLLTDLESLTQSDNEMVSSTANEILREVEAIVKGTKGHETGLTPEAQRVALAFIMGLPWVALSLTGVVEAFRREPDWQYGLFGCLFLGAMLATAAYYVPPSIHWFYRYVLIPGLTYAVLLSVLYAIADDDGDEGSEASAA